MDMAIAALDVMSMFSILVKHHGVLSKQAPDIVIGPSDTNAQVDKCYDSKGHWGLISGQYFDTQGWNILICGAEC